MIDNVGTCFRLQNTQETTAPNEDEGSDTDRESDSNSEEINVINLCATESRRTLAPSMQ